MISFVIQGASTAMKVYSTYQACSQIKEVYDNKDRTTGEVVNAVVQGAFAACQVVDFGLSAASSISKFSTAQKLADSAQKAKDAATRAAQATRAAKKAAEALKGAKDVVEATKKAKDLAENASQLAKTAVAAKKAAIAAKTAAEAAQAADKLNKVRVGVNIATGITATAAATTESVVQKGSLRKLNKGDLWKIFKVAAFRAVDGVNKAHEELSDVLKWDTQTVQNWTEGLSTAVVVVDTPAVQAAVIQIGRDLRERVRRRRQGIALANQAPVPQQAPLVRDRTVAQAAMSQQVAPAPQMPAPEEVLPDIDAGVAQEAEAIAEGEINALIQGLEDNFANLQSIPSILYDHKVFKQNICCITRNPIRFIVVPDLPRRVRNANPSLKYEKSSIQDWVRARPNQNPPDWPAEIPFDAQLLLEDAPLQNIIDDNLKVAAEEHRDFLLINQN